MRNGTGWGVCFLFKLLLVVTIARGATVVGNLRDIHQQDLNTKLVFAPTTNVLLTPAGLSAGPPRTLDTVNGQFSVVLEAGDYTVSLPLVSWRKPFGISVFETNGTINITNLLSAPKTYTYTNNLNWVPNGTNLFFLAGKVGIGVTNPSAALEIQSSSGPDPQLLLSTTNTVGGTRLEFKSPDSAANWQLGTSADAFQVGKSGLGNFLSIDAEGLVSAVSLAVGNGSATVNNNGSATFANGLAQIGADGSASFLNGDVVVNTDVRLHLKNDSTDLLPNQLWIEATGDGAVGLQLQSPQSTNHWQVALKDDTFRIGKVEVNDYLKIDASGRLTVSQGFAVGMAVGISTNLAVLTPGPKTNVLVFTKGILTNVQ